MREAELILFEAAAARDSSGGSRDPEEEEEEGDEGESEEGGRKRRDAAGEGGVRRALSALSRPAGAVGLPLPRTRGAPGPPGVRDGPRRAIKGAQR